MNIICDHDFRKLVKELDGFEMDLGKAYTKKDPVKNTIEADIKDEFVIKFLRKYKGLIYKVGRLGPINIYTYDKLSLGKILLINKEKIKEVNFDKKLAKLNFKKYFAKLIYDFENSDNETKRKEKKEKKN